MPELETLRSGIFKSGGNFSGVALAVFNYQYSNNSVYREFADNLRKTPVHVKSISQIPFLPVEFFRNHMIISGEQSFSTVFESSGTTGTSPGKHYVKDLDLYEESFLNGFRIFYGDPRDYLIVALLPSYTERSGSSLVYMAGHLIKMSSNPDSGFYRNDTDQLLSVIQKAKSQRKKVLLLGVTFALLDLAEDRQPDLSDVIVMETGGMKGRRKELTRSELHQILTQKFNVRSIHSEYGMTELMSQAYSKGEGIFHCPPWMKILIRDPQDPLTVYNEPAGTGGINIIDLANLNSCSFLATGDLGKIHENNGFEVLGRFDNSDIRGCNLMVE